MSLPDLFTSPRRTLDPIERISEVLFGLIMVLTFTLTLSVAEGGQGEVRTMLIGALGCNLAWGVIDAVFYLMAALAQRGHNLTAFRAARSENDPVRAQGIIADALPPMIASLMQPAVLEALRLRLKQVPEPKKYVRLTLDDWKGAAGVCLLVFLSTFPVVIPFTFMHDVTRALRFSNAIAVVLLYVMGYAFGRITGRRPVLIGVAMVVFGAALVAMTIALGG